ncbi:hypothetical protein BGZ75_001748, partial [Mortierella antarctica]
MTDNTSFPNNTQESATSAGSASRATPAPRPTTAAPVEQNTDTIDQQPSTEPSHASPRRVAFVIPEGPHSFADAQLRCRLRPRRLAPPSVEVETAATALANAGVMLQELRRARALYAVYQLNTLSEHWDMHAADFDAAYPLTVMPRPHPQLEQQFAGYENASNLCSSAIRRVKRCLSPLNDILNRHTTYQLTDRTTQDEVVERVVGVKRQCMREGNSQPNAHENAAPDTVPIQALQTVHDAAPVPPRG